MSYIGGTRSLLILGSNTKDDLVPVAGNNTTFTLSQEVPGGYESNVIVVKQKYREYPLISNTTTISISAGGDASYKILSCNNATVAAVLASKITIGDNLHITTNIVGSYYNNTFKVINLTYDGTTIQVSLQVTGSGTSQTVSSGTQVQLSLGKLSDWDILEPEIDYVISGEGSVQNRQITLSEGILTYDKAYVLHKGEATYNLVPSSKSVGPEQLSENLRNFTCDRYTGNGTKTTFALSNTEHSEYTVVDAKTLLVTVNNQVSDSDALGFVGEWSLDQTRDVDGKQTITFHNAPATGAKIRILHLGFSTISRRANFAEGQSTYIPAESSVGTNQIQNLAVTESKLNNGSVSTRTLINSSVTSEKISLTNNVALSGKKSDGSTQELLKLDSTNKTVLNALSESVFTVNGVPKVSLTTSNVLAQDGTVSLGSDTKKFKDLFLSGDIAATKAVFSSTVTATNITQLTTKVTSLESDLPGKVGVPIGTIVMWPSGNNTSIPKNWRRCDGQTLNTYDFKELHKIISSTYGGDAYVSGQTDQSGASNTFKLPDMVTRFPVGADDTASNIGSNDGVASGSRTIHHSHIAPAHTHTFEHTHFTKGHYHNVGPVATTGSTLQITNSGTHKTTLDHSHRNFNPNGTTVSGVQFQDKITVGAGSHNHTGTTDLCSSLEHVHRSWPQRASALGTSSLNPISGDTVAQLCGNQWSEWTSTSNNTPVTTDTKPTGIVRNDDVVKINRHTHDIPSSGTQTAAHSHSSATYISGATNIGDYTVSTGDVASASAVNRITGIVSVASQTVGDLKDHTHKITPFYTDFPYTRSNSDFGGSSNSNTYHTDLANKRTSLKHSHTFTISSSGSHSHDVEILFKGDVSGGEHTHNTAAFSGALGQIATKTITDSTTLSKLGATSSRPARTVTGGLTQDGNSDLETTGVSKVQVAGGTWEESKTSNPIYSGTNNTDPASSPFIVVNFIIKVSDNEV